MTLGTSLWATWDGVEQGRRNSKERELGAVNEQEQADEKQTKLLLGFGCAICDTSALFFYQRKFEDWLKDVKPDAKSVLPRAFFMSSILSSH